MPPTKPFEEFSWF